MAASISIVDEEGRVDAMRRAKIKAQAKIDAELNLRRARAKELWGVSMMYQLSRCYKK